ncbi:MAG: DUF1735 domain-containing protein [Bacteroidales bacterium]|nr:DUF1735 domain-containing protein [Bacteroidales bacterium]
MKKSIIIALIAVLAVTVSCQKPEEIWEDNANPEVFIPRYGYTFTDVWNVTSGTFETYLGVYCGGLRPANQKKTITVNYAVDNSLVDAYNEDITQQYQGELVALPADCYSLSSSSVSILPGEVDTRIPIKFNISAINAAAAANPGKRLVLPFKLTGTSEYSLSAEKGYTESLMEVNVADPNFYFFCNNYEVALESAKLIYGTKDNKYKYDVIAQGVPDGNYTINFAYDLDALNAVYPGVDACPEDAVVIKESSVYKDRSNHAYLEFELIPEKLEFFKTYYLPISITSASEYAGDPTRGTFFMTVEMKNEFEKTYSSILMVSNVEYDESLPNFAGDVTRSGAYSAKKSATTYDSDILEVNMCANNTIAGATADKQSSTSYNNRYIRIKVIPGDDKSHYAVEFIPVTDKAKKNNTPDYFEQDPTAESYYDWNEEKFVLNYRWKNIVKKDTNWVYVQEIMQAN